MLLTPWFGGQMKPFQILSVMQYSCFALEGDFYRHLSRNLQAFFMQHMIFFCFNQHPQTAYKEKSPGLVQ